ncbi:Histidine kinase [Vibrio chagasii]|nr:Histidine kinase [Vibrio chagasii]CAH6950279.1 Histidine kinase [Vibrio chagasii]CAH7003386.1 Histidine kinase [Vibrio chagasii]CAH7006060.1 Histidine kinase [Vibrio chagasii]CAH7034648.1 Histidine kinase [Vibrio chagasii]
MTLDYSLPTSNLMKFQTKTFLGIALIEVFFLALLVVFATNFIADSNRALFESKIETTLNLLKLSSLDALLTYDIARLESIAQNVIKDPDIVSLTMSISGSEVVIVGNRDAYHTDSILIEGMIFKGMDVHIDGMVIGRIDAIFDERAILSHIESSSQYLIMIASIEVAFVAIASLLFSRLLVKELRKVTKAIEDIEVSGPGLTLSYEKNDEIGQVISAFNRMSVEMRKQYVQLSLAKESAQSANRAKDDFLSVVSHEMRTPLNGILGMAQILGEGVDEAKKEQISIIVSSGEHLLLIINDILDIAKMEQGKLELRIEPFSLEALVQEVKNAFDNTCKQKSLDYVVTTEHIEGTYLAGDNTRLKQVIFNLLGNAVKFTKKGAVTCHFQWLESESRLTITITDTGIGIPTDKLETIFKPFSQADSSTTRHFGGTGLGLAIVTQLLELMSGKIELVSEVNVGSQCTVTLPMPSVITKPNRFSNAFSTQTHCFKGRALIIDDNQINLIVGELTCKKFGFDVDTTSQAEEALNLIKVNDYLFILVDLHMPDISGLELIKIINQVDEVAVLFGYTADMSIKSIRDFEQAGTQGVLPKPLTDKAFRQVVINYFMNSISRSKT